MSTFDAARAVEESLFLMAGPSSEPCVCATAIDDPERMRPAELVSVIVPFCGGPRAVVNAGASALSQTYPSIELILVDDGSHEDVSFVEAFAERDARVRLVRQAKKGLAAARNRGIEEAAGEYVAFLDPDDRFLAEKVEWQLMAMHGTRSSASHTSYHVTFPDRSSRLVTIDSGHFSGQVYPEIMAKCPIATPTVMVDRSVLNAGFHFPETHRVCDDTYAWIWLAQRYPILGVPRPLTVVEWSSTSAEITLSKTVPRIFDLITNMKRDTGHSRHLVEIARLEAFWNRLLEYNAVQLNATYWSGLHEDYIASVGFIPEETA